MTGSEESRSIGLQLQYDLLRLLGSEFRSCITIEACQNSHHHCKIGDDGSEVG